MGLEKWQNMANQTSPSHLDLQKFNILKTLRCITGNAPRDKIRNEDVRLRDPKCNKLDQTQKMSVQTE